jgi:hypothetical protein
MKKWTCIILAVLIVLSVVFFIGRWSTVKERSRQTANLKASRDSVSFFQFKIGNLEYQASEKDALILSQKEAIKAGILERDYLRKLHLKEVETNTHLKALIKVLRDSLDLPPETIIITIKDTAGISHHYMKIPFQNIKYKDNYLSLNAGVDELKKAWFDLEVPFSGSVTVGYKKNGFLKTKPIGVFVTDNKHIKVINMDVFINKKEIRWYQRWWVHSLAGAGTVATLWYLTDK